MTNEKCIVESHEEIGSGYRFLVFRARFMAPQICPGQFVHVKVPALEKSALRRPFSVFDAENDRVTVLYKTVGRGTLALNAVKPGDTIEVMGPLQQTLGKGFPEKCEGTAMLVGGGFGVAPLYALARRLIARGKPASAIKLFVGGRTKEDLLALDRFAKLGVEVFATTNDGSYGVKGFAVVPLDEEVKKLREQGAKFELFTCGPDGLLKAVSDRAMSLGVPGWISMDRHMICGVGACYACIQKTVRGNSRCCIEGPVFAAEDLVW